MILIIVTQWYTDNYNAFWLDYYTISLLVDDKIDIHPNILDFINPYECF
jgi:hypothetical protein